MDDLLACPCGGSPIRHETVIAPELYIECDLCHVRVFGENDLVVVEKWNKRSADSASTGQTE